MRHHPQFIVAALCTAALVTVTAASALADHKPGHNPPGHRRGDDGPGRGHAGGPPAWAPAWGYRNKRTVRYRHHGVVREADSRDLVRLPDVGLGRCNRDLIGAILGGTVGAAAGSQIGKGDGRTLATIGGAIVGALVGGNIGRAMDQVDQNCVGQVLERTPDGKPVVWDDPDRKVGYSVTPSRTWQSNDGTYCREYQTKVVIDGKVETAHGTACRQTDGTWKKI